MRLLIEKYEYPPSVFDALGIPEDWRLTLRSGKQSLDKVGYFRAAIAKEPVFILPKIFESGDNVFGTIPILDLATLPTPEVFKKHPEGQRHLEWLYRFSLSLYLSLRTYRQRNKETIVSNPTHFQNIVANTPDDETTELERVLTILEFYRSHHDLVVFTEKQNQSQHFRKTNWAKTIRTQQPFFTQNKTPVYLTTVEKQRHRNNDDELLRIFYSVLKHFKKQYGFRLNIETSLDLFEKIDTPSVSAQLVRRLKDLKNTYFADHFRKLLNLLLLYFQRASEARTQEGGKEYLLCHSYHVVFEDMIDDLISDPQVEKELKYHSDGKIVDHLFSHASLFAPDDIWYIGDSKYYKETTPLSKNAVYKQHTYAKNIIQYNINLFNNNKEGKGRYRDELTEGYNVTPNFFIQAFVHHDDLFKTDAEFDKTTDTEPLLNYHFENRLFDRDTLSIHPFKINFLFVLRSYITQNTTEKQVFKTNAIKTIRETVLAFYEKQYEFFTAVFDNKHSLETFVKTHFKDLNGKIYQTSANDGLLWLALDKKQTTENSKIKGIFDKVGVDIRQKNLIPLSR
jgi:hypothetical protein